MARAKRVGNIQLRVGQVPGSIIDIVLDEGATIEDAVKASEYPYEGREVRLNGVAEKDIGKVKVANGDTVIILKKIEGGRD